MKCGERGCLFPPRQNGYCGQHQWRAPDAAVIEGVSVRSSLTWTPRSTGETVQVRAVESRLASFTPRITIKPSTVNPGATVYVHHWPDGDQEVYGRVGVMAFSVSQDRYITELRKRFSIMADASKVGDPNPTETAISAAQIPATEPLRAKNVSMDKPRKSQAEIVMEALVSGAATAAEAAAKTGLSSSTCSAVISAFRSKGKVHQVTVRPDRTVVWALGQAPVVASAPISIKPAVPPLQVVAAPIEHAVSALSPTPPNDAPLNLAPLMILLDQKKARIEERYRSELAELEKDLAAVHIVARLLVHSSAP